MKSAQLTFEYDKPNKCGFYLDKLEIYNWGTFHNKIWKITPATDPSLITGDFGSGKSTIVDALTALLVPPNKIIFNKSAGAEKQERNFNSYVFGYYKSESDEGNRKGYKKGLRENRKSFTSLLAVFKNQESLKTVTVAQIMIPRPKGDQRPPDKIFIVSERELSTETHIGQEYARRGKAKYRKWISEEDRVYTFDSFSSYSDSFRRFLYLKNPQALDLFHKAISLKQIENLTTFVKNHMLEEHEVNEKISELCSSYEQLNELHDTVVKERKQVDHLERIQEHNKGYLENEIKENLFREARDSSEKYFANLKVKEYTRKIDELTQTLEAVERKIESVKEKANKNDDDLSALTTQIAKAGGGLANELKQKIKEVEPQLNERKSREAKYFELADLLEIKKPKDEDSFHKNFRYLKENITSYESEKDSIKTNYDSNIVLFNKTKEIISDLENEITFLRDRKSNIPYNISNLRSVMAKNLSCRPEDLPFIGELIKVNEKEKKWEGAIERVLRSFGLSILVEEKLYTKVSQYVDRTHLRGKIVYLRIPPTDLHTKYHKPKEENSLAFKLRIKEDTVFHQWLWGQICRRLDYACTTTIEEFRRKEKAITINGQIKSNRNRHEKDDRRPVNDKSNYILGWNNKEKIKELNEQLEVKKKVAQEVAKKISDINHKEKIIQEKIRNSLRLLDFTHYSEISWKPLQANIDAKKEELHAVEKTESTSKILSQLRKREQELKRTKEKIKSKESQLIEERATSRHSLETYSKNLEREKPKVTAMNSRDLKTLFPMLEKIHLESSQNETIEESEKNVTKILTGKIESISRVRGGKRSEMEKKMESFKMIWPQDSYDLEATIRGVEDFLQRLKKLQDDQLPKHEKKFREKLRTDTINNVAIFKSQLESYKNDIEERVTSINNSLRSVNFSPSTYIQLLYRANPDEEIRNFREEIRAVLSDRFTNDLYTEDKYLQIKMLIEKFKGREGKSDQDRRWAKKVTDVRNWFTFAASEKYQDTEDEKEYYPDSGGKSGGEKERLAYTVLASALIYQYGEGFKFVIIDEAFGKGSEESARFGMELFKELGLQILVITPLQKINVIEKYIKKVHFVRKVGKESYVDDWTIDEYQERKREYLKGKTSASIQEVMDQEAIDQEETQEKMEEVISK